MSGTLDEIELALDRFDLLVDAAHPALIADDIKIATVVRSRPPDWRMSSSPRTRWIRGLMSREWFVTT